MRNEFVNIGNNIYMKKFYFTLILIHIFAVVCVQICLNLGGTRETFTNIDTLEGVSRTGYINFITPCEVELEVTPFHPGNNLKILISGRTAAFFTEPRVRLAVKSNALIEIDAREEDVNYLIKVSDASENVNESSRNLEVRTNKNISILGKIFAN